MESVFEGSRSAGSRDFMKKNTKGVTPAGDTRDYTLPREKLDLINVVLATIPGSVVLVLSFFFPSPFLPSVWLMSTLEKADVGEAWPLHPDRL